MVWQTRRVPPAFDLLAPDGSEIRLLVQVRGGSLAHCTVQPGQVTRAVQHRTVDEVWFCVSGSGQLWRRAAADHTAEIVELEAGVAATVPLGTIFQVRATSRSPLELILTTLPPWPGPDEAILTTGIWEGEPR